MSISQFYLAHYSGGSGETVFVDQVAGIVEIQNSTNIIELSETVHQVSVLDDTLEIDVTIELEIAEIVSEAYDVSN